MKEFELINFLKNHPSGASFPSIGDDCAVIDAADFTGQGYLLINTDTMIEGHHFLREQTSARDLGWKVMAQAASDIAAMGGKPMAATIGLTLPKPETLGDCYLKELYSGITDFNNHYNTSLIGGDTCFGSDFSMNITFLGRCSVSPVARSTARENDQIWVSGSIGLAGKGLALTQADRDQQLTNSERELVERAFYRPAPMVELGEKLATIASSMIDISDGLLADLSHICEASKKSAVLDLEKIPVLPSDRGSEKNILKASSAGEDYQLLFTVNPSQQASIEKIGAQLNTPLTLVGEISSSSLKTEVLIRTDGNLQPMAKLLESHGLPSRGGWEHSA